MEKSVKKSGHLRQYLKQALDQTGLRVVLIRLLTRGITRMMAMLRRLGPDQHGVMHQDLCSWSMDRLLEAGPNAVDRSAARTLLVEQSPTEARFLVPSLEKRLSPVMNTWTYQNEVMEWDIAPDELVLDVGSGGWPFKRANHLADRYPAETTHRVEGLVRDERPFFEADLASLPFEDKAYDFVFCSHVLEHLDHPGQAIRELMRVASRGYIEVPTRLSDVMFNFTRLPNHHRWHGMMLGKTLVLMEWNNWEREDLGNYFFNALQSDYRNDFQSFFERNRSLFFISCNWTEKIDFLILDNQGNVIDSSRSMP